MHLTPREQERLLIAAAADLARRRISRGARLGATEAIALLCDEVLEMAWDGTSLAEIVERAAAVVPRDRLLPGVAGAVPDVQVEALFPHGTSLVYIARPFGPPDEHAPGAVLPVDGEIDLAPGRRRADVEITNTGERPVWVSSHYPLEQANAALDLDREAVRGYRLDLPAGVATRFAPGERRTVAIVQRGGGRR